MLLTFPPSCSLGPETFDTVSLLLIKIFEEAFRSPCNKQINHLMIHNCLTFLKHGEVLNQANEFSLLFLSVTDRTSSRKMSLEQK